VFCTDGVFCMCSGRVLHRRGVLNQHAFYAFFRACFAPTVRFPFFPGEFCTGGAFCGSPGIFLAVCAFYGFCEAVPQSRGVSRHGVLCPRECDTVQACAPCRCVTHTRGVWRWRQRGVSFLQGVKRLRPLERITPEVPFLPESSGVLQLQHPCV
jgi:hypothetical protein